MLAPWKKSYGKPRLCTKKQRHHFADKGSYSQSYGFSSSHVQVWELVCKEVWTLKNGCFQTVVLERTLESPLNSKEIKPVNLKGNQCWIFIGLMLKLKLQYVGLLMQRTDSLEKTLSSSVVPFSSCPQSFPALGSFQMSHLFTSGGQSIGVSA